MVELFNIDENRVCDFVEFDPAYTIKFTTQRERPDASFDGDDVFGSQQYPQLFDWA
ncbi:MAG: DUF4387 domain-containing protein [Proteobacteria bacterium]|nr:DUF4387 domain-containing protein [Pseudomonadota bacterium]